MLPKHDRLTRLEVEIIKRTRITPLSSQFFGLVRLVKTGEPKFGVIVSTKLSKSAVVRNRIRRTVYRAIYPIIDQQKGWHLFLVKKNIVEAKREQVEKDVQKLLGFRKTQKTQ